MGQGEKRKPPEIVSAEISSAETEFLKIILAIKNKKFTSVFLRRQKYLQTHSVLEFYN
jgi:hypothetical protein